MWFDSHCHLDFPEFDPDRTEVWQRARTGGVTQSFVPGVSPAQWERLGALRRALPGACVGIGLHPYFLARLSATEREAALDDLPRNYARVGATAIGECGLHRPGAGQSGLTLPLQLEVLERHLVVARELVAPLVLHVVGAHGAALDLLERFGRFPAGGVLHSYSGPAELVSRYARLGFSFGFSGGVCRARARKAHEAVRAVPLDRLLLETDAPDQPPPAVRARGRERTEPVDLLLVAEAVARLRDLSLEALSAATTRNAAALFTR